MGRLVYHQIMSLDGYVEDAGGRFDWAAPDEEVHAFVNEKERSFGTFLYGRRLYETMRFWETASGPGVTDDYAAIWRAAEKVVYSRTLAEPLTARTRVERDFEGGAVRQLVAESPTDVAVGGAELGGRALALGLVHEVRLTVVPVLVGGGKRALPAGVRLDLAFLGEHRFGSGTVHLAYAVR